jgi:transcription elongation GreA/GreB family factor
VSLRISNVLVPPGVGTNTSSPTSSPIGRALIGKEEGDEVLVPTPGGTRTFEILKLTTIHEE